MCGRYGFDPKDWNEYFNKKGIKVKLKKLEPNYNVFPTMQMPIIRDIDMKEVVLMRWGLLPFWVKDLKFFKKPLINARVEDIQNKPAFRRAIRSQRCLVLANGFWEWLVSLKERIPYYIKLKGQDIFFLAGIWESWKDAEGREILSFAIITGPPNDLVSKIHDRQANIFSVMDEKALRTWLDPKTPLEEVLKLLQPYNAKNMEAYPVRRFTQEQHSKDIINPIDEQKELF